jgi:hypothetical protein
MEVGAPGMSTRSTRDRCVREKYWLLCPGKLWRKVRVLKCDEWSQNGLEMACFLGEKWGNSHNDSYFLLICENGYGKLKAMQTCTILSPCAYAIAKTVSWEYFPFGVREVPGSIPGECGAFCRLFAVFVHFRLIRAEFAEA